MIERNTTIGTAQQRMSAWVRCQESASTLADPAFPRKFMSELLDDELQCVANQRLSTHDVLRHDSRRMDQRASRAEYFKQLAGFSLD